MTQLEWDNARINRAIVPLTPRWWCQAISPAPCPPTLRQLLTCGTFLFLDVTLFVSLPAPLPLWISRMLQLISDCGIADVDGLGCIFRN